MDDSRDPTPEESGLPRELEAALAAGFGRCEAVPPDSMPSVLQELASRSGVRPRVRLRDEPVERPPRALRPGGLSGEGSHDIGGKYQIQGELARGGVGVVLKGHDTDLGRDVAVKVLHEKYVARPELVERFVEEAQIGGQLQHPGVVPVYDLGIRDGRPYFTMKLIKGRTLASIFDGEDGSPTGRHAQLAIFASVCQTMAYAHARGVIHRDLKPANVMVGAFGEVQVVDWGMGKVLAAGGSADDSRSPERAPSVIETVRSHPGSGSSHSVVGSVMGTPAYMPPEQANGDVEHMDERSDVFALGAILCEVLTGEPPYVGDAAERIQLAASAELGPCRRRVELSDADRELRALCLDCLKTAPAARPRHAGVVADRIQAYLAGSEERARGAQIEAAEERVRTREARRTQRLTIALAVLGMALLVAVGGGLWGIERTAQERRVRAARAVAGLLKEASGAAGEARSAVEGDLDLWDRAVDAGERALRRAEQGDVDPELHEEARLLLAQVVEDAAVARERIRRRERDELMHERLITLRIPPNEQGLRWGEWQREEEERMDTEYAAAFRAFLGGVELFALDWSEASSRLGAGANAVELAAALDHWGLLRDSLQRQGVDRSEDETDFLRLVASRVDPPDRWRSRLRALLPGVVDNRAALEELAEEVELAELPEVSVVLLGEALWLAGSSQRATEVYRRGRVVYPQDFGICLRLGLLLRQQEPQPHEELVEVFRIACALRPHLWEARHLQAVSLEQLGRYEEVRLLCEDGRRREPEERDWIGHLMWAVKSQGDFESTLGVASVLEEAFASGGLSSGPKISDAADHRAVALRALGRHEEALLEARRGLRVAEDWILDAEEDPGEWIRSKRDTLAARVQELEGLLAEEPALNAVLEGTRAASSPEEWARAASLAFDRRAYGLAARTWRELLAAHPGTRADEGGRGAAARAAALCGAGVGADASALDEAERRAWRAQALEWLRRELEHLPERPELESEGVRGELKSWQRDWAFATLRGGEALGRLPAGERAAWRELWSGVGLELARIEDELAD